jgi:hypothetical protein
MSFEELGFSLLMALQPCFSFLFFFWKVNLSFAQD